LLGSLFDREDVSSSFLRNVGEGIALVPLIYTAVRISNATKISGVLVLEYQKMDGF
jgi:hypothetical protein